MVDAGVDITLVKENYLSYPAEFDSSKILEMKGIGNGVIKTLGFINLNIFELPCIAHIVTDDFPLSSVGLLGWDVLKIYHGKINAGENFRAWWTRSTLN